MRKHIRKRRTEKLRSKKLKKRLREKRKGVFMLLVALALVVMWAGILFQFRQFRVFIFVPQSTFQVISPAEWRGVIPQNIISPEEAVVKALRVEGYETERVLVFEAVRGEEDDMWYWGVKTPRGTVTVKAGKEAPTSTIDTE